MARFSADYYDGRRSARRPVEVDVDGDALRIRGEGVSLDVKLADLAYAPRLGGMPLRVSLPGGGALVVSSAAAAHLPVPPASGLAHRLESHRGVVVAALAGLVLAGWLGHRYAIPWVAREVAMRLPPAIEADLAEESLDALDRLAFKKTRLEPGRQERLHALFAPLAEAAGAKDARLELRDGGWIGPNALAIPGGVIVLTDPLVELLGDDERIGAVLAHEIGHHRHRHGLRHVLQDSFVALAAMALFGDASAVANVAATVPTVLVHTGYSRDFEREADRFAVELLRKTGRSPRLLGEALRAIEESVSRPPGGAERVRAADLGYLSTHPATEERVRAALEAAGTPEKSR